LAQRVSFEGRQHSLPQDAVNALLNYGYGILYSKIWSALVFAGLDPYAGFLHKEQTGKPSLVFDMIEEFRAPIVDRTVIAFVMLNRNVSISGGLLTLETRQSFSEKILNRLTSLEYYKGKKVMINDILLIQAKSLADFIEEKTDAYAPFTFKW
jgi:CRISPR-associated protein Cas1